MKREVPCKSREAACKKGVGPLNGYFSSSCMCVFCVKFEQNALYTVKPV